MEVLSVSARWVVYAEVFVGGEVEVSDHVALSLRVPVDLLVGGEPAREERYTTMAALDLQAPDASAVLATGALLIVECAAVREHQHIIFFHRAEGLMHAYQQKHH